MCLVTALMCASGVPASPGCLGRFPRLGLSSPYLPLPAGKSLGWSRLAEGVMDSMPVLAVVPTVLQQSPQSPQPSSLFSHLPLTAQAVGLCSGDALKSCP